MRLMIITVCARMYTDVLTVQASPATVLCHKAENINMLSLQQGASHQGNNSDRHTRTQSAKTHRLKSTSKTSHLKRCSHKHEIKGRLRTHCNRSGLIKLCNIYSFT